MFYVKKIKFYVRETSPTGNQFDIIFDSKEDEQTEKLFLKLESHKE
jgi:hypothetical protein